MIVTGEAKYISAKSGSKNGKGWYILKFLYEEADEFFTLFVEKELFDALEGLPKNTPIILTLHIVPGQKYLRLENLEIMK